MTNEKAVEIIRGQLGDLIMPYSDEMVAFGMAIEALMNTHIKRGHWIDHIEESWVYAKCSECGKIHNIKHKYCNGCGAKMDWGEEA